MPVDILDLQGRIARLEQQMAGVPNQPVTIYDGAGIPRVQLGNLKANGISPAQYGVRVNDSTNTPIFDSLGLISVMTSLGSAGSLNGLLTTGGPATVPGSSLAFTLARTTSVLVLTAIQGNATGASGTNIIIVGTNGSVSPTWLTDTPLTFAQGVAVATQASYAFARIDAGSWTVSLQYTVSGTNFNLQQGGLDIFGLGS